MFTLTAERPRRWGCASPVCGRINILRGTGPTARNAIKTHCDHGHEFTPENTYAKPSGGRQCRACTRWHGRNRDRHNREVQRAGSS